ncbi:MAG: hypothetical protein KDK99_11420 [Verrucomicrobiales bacterium]|nr:hypothetical protein [Verrucomicrobiales bacterium]
MTRPLFFLLAGLCGLAACSRDQSATAEPESVESATAMADPDAATPAMPPPPVQEATTAADVFSQPPPPPMHLGGFGSDEPVEREDAPTQGVVEVSGDQLSHQSMTHWEQWDGGIAVTERPGSFKVELMHSIQPTGQPVQFKLGETRLKSPLKASIQPTTTDLGTLKLEAGEHGFGLYMPAAPITSQVTFHAVRLVPAPEGDEAPEKLADGSLVFHARNATTWSRLMRYEPQAEKDCLGFWSDPDDVAEWSFTMDQPGRYDVVVTQGCGTGQGGSEVAVRLGDSEGRFKVEDTGGFQNWKDVSAGTIEVKSVGMQHLQIAPLGKTGKAVMDVKKVTLKPVS